MNTKPNILKAFVQNKEGAYPLVAQICYFLESNLLVALALLNNLELAISLMSILLQNNCDSSFSVIQNVDMVGIFVQYPDRNKLKIIAQVDNFTS